MPETSIVIRTFNEEKYLPDLFEGIAAQTYRDFEIIVVDSGSFDRSREIARHYNAHLVRIKSDDFTFGHSLNTGVAQSRGKYIVIVSAHTLPADNSWLGNLLDPLKNENVGMVYGRQIGRSESKFSEWMDFERTFGRDRLVLAPPNFFGNNANSAIRRDLFDEHPFDETLPGLEDIEWAKHWIGRGYQAVYEPSAAIYHIHTETWEQVRRRYYREAVAAKRIGIRNRRQIFRDVFRETSYLAGDIFRALRDGRLSEKGKEIGRFRYEKTLGTIAGVWDGAAVENPATRSSVFFNTEYNAVVIERPGSASLRKISLPPLKPGEVLVRVAYEGVCATDLEILDGHLGYYKSGLAKYPIVPGHEFSGTVAAVGVRVTNLNEGDRVVVECIQGCGECAACKKRNWIGCAERREVGVIRRDGAYADYMVTPARFAHKLPSSIGLLQAALCEPAAVAVKGLSRLQRSWPATPGPRSCAVVGAGAIGHLTARILAQRGHRVTVFDRDDRRLTWFEGSGIGTEQDLSALSGFDSIIEATGDPNALESVLHMSAPDSTILLLGLPYARRDFSFETIVGYDKVVVGSVGSSAEDFETAIATLPRINTHAFTQQVLPLSEFAHAWEIARSRKHLKVILKVDGAVSG